MKSTPSKYDPSDLDATNDVDVQAGDVTSSSVALLDLPTDERTDSDEWTGARCEKCNAPMKSDMVTVCRRCGWYASLNRFVEIDANWETGDDSAGEVAPTSQKSHAKVWSELVPWWGRVIIASVLAVVVESIVARFVTPAGSGLRTIWSLAQLAIGLLTAIGCHFFNFMVQAAEDSDVGVLDLVLKPIKLWLRAFRLLPTRWWVTDAAVCGVTAALMSVLVIGGIPYERLWDWGFTPPVKQDLMGAVMDRVKQVDQQKADSLEDAVGDFAGKAGLDEDAKKATPQKPLHHADCVIIGYQLDKDEQLSALVLGTAHLGRLVYAGNVAPKFTDDAEAIEIMSMLMAARTSQRLLPVEIEANWVKPTITCRVTYDQRQKDGRLTDVKWDMFMGTMKSKKK